MLNISFITVPCFSFINFDCTVQIWKIWPLGHLVHQFMNAFTDHRDSDLLVVRCVNITKTAYFATPNGYILTNLIPVLSYYSATSHCCWDARFLFGCLLAILIDHLHHLLEF